MGFLQDTITVFGSANNLQRTYSTAYRDNIMRLCRREVEGCYHYNASVTGLPMVDCENTSSLTVTNEMFGGDGTFVVTYSNTDPNKKYVITVDVAWVLKNEKCAIIEGDPMIQTFDGESYRL